jgi:hypothetical protein
VQSAKVFLAKSHPGFFALGAPEVAGQAADQALTVIVDLNQLLATLVAAAAQLSLHFRIVFSRYCSTVSPLRIAVSCSSV